MAYRDSSATVLRRRPGTLAVPGVVAAVGLGLSVLLRLHVAGVPVWGPYVFLAGLFSLLASWSVSPFPVARRAALEANDKGVLLDGSLWAARADLTEGYVQPGEKGPLVRVRGRRRFDVRARTNDDAEALLSALRLDASLARVTFWSPSPLIVDGVGIAAVVLAMVATMLLSSRLHGSRGFPTPILMLVLLTQLPKRIVAGADGVRVAWLGLGRFIAFAEIAQVAADETTVTLVLKKGPPMTIRFEGPAWLTRDRLLIRGLYGKQREALAERLREGLRASRSRERDGDVASLLVRGGRPTAEWLVSLRALGTAAEGSYRGASVPRDRLWRIVNNTSATAEERAAAAIALRSGIDEEGRTRLTTLAEATAAPRVRVALRRAAAEDEVDAELGEVLLACEEEARARREP